MRFTIAVLVLALAAGPALAAPTLTVAPADGARFLTAQRFDLRVEGKGAGPYSATLEIDGVPVPFTSGLQDTTTTDGITVAGYGGFNVRGWSSTAPGPHVVRATFTDATGTATSTTRFEVIDPFTRRGGLGKPLKNVILMVGDGMGVAHRTAARIVRYGVKGGQPQGWLAMDRFPGTGLVTTHSLNSIITDSAPGMACYSTGNHANNNQEGVFPSPGIANPFFAPRVEYMSEYLHRVKGTSLGLVTTADVEDATPAANAVHTLNRNAGQGIVDQYLDEADAAGAGTHGTGLAVLMGGGRRWFLPSGQYGSSRSSSNDYPALPGDLVAGWSLPPSGGVDPARNLVADFEAAGFEYAESKAKLDALTAGKVPAKLLGLFGYGNMNVAVDKLAKRRGTLLAGASTYSVDDYHAPDQPMLDEMTAAALKVLRKNRNGFVLMVEGAHIDKQSHLMDAERAIGEVIEFDRAVEVARRFADEERDTLVLVMADHECSGFSLIGALAGGVAALQGAPSDAAKLDPATQPERQKKVGTYDAASFPRYTILEDGYPASYDVDGKMLVGYGASGDRFETWLARPRPVIDSLLPSDIKGELASASYVGVPVLRPEDAANGFFLRGQAVGRDQAVHTAADIPLSAYSSPASTAWQKFVGVQTNTDVFFKVMQSVLTDDG